MFEKSLPKCPACKAEMVFPLNKYLGHLVCPKRNCDYSEGGKAWEQTNSQDEMGAQK